MQIILSESEALVLRTIGAKINGTLGGKSRSKRKQASSRKNVRKAIKARIATAA